MDKEGADFDSTLKQAQDLGYAERNPELISKAMTQLERLLY